MALFYLVKPMANGNALVQPIHPNKTQKSSLMPTWDTMANNGAGNPSNVQIGNKGMHVDSWIPNQ
eukprot:CAMPEP_0114539138 /NCGR_PEP_ID=MMETSP0114-20121206/79_1 /TAXON_ID=31324 /ORGANISM="Goniomonas sp, Strain m" /LENGTH=64 /DNA_ID=CAMNT_0001723223 /DNA_START=140 /DNA_END=334 /DNA_ORIENTATION=+